MTNPIRTFVMAAVLTTAASSFAGSAHDGAGEAAVPAHPTGRAVADGEVRRSPSRGPSVLDAEDEELALEQERKQIRELLDQMGLLDRLNGNVDLSQSGEFEARPRANQP